MIIVGSPIGSNLVGLPLIQGLLLPAVAGGKCD